MTPPTAEHKKRLTEVNHRWPKLTELDRRRLSDLVDDLRCSNGDRGESA